MTLAQSTASKQRWKNPETREKMLEGARKGRENYNLMGRPGPYRGPVHSKKESPKMPRRTNRPWTGAELKRLEVLIHEGFGWADIASILNRPYFSVTSSKPARAEMTRRKQLREEHYFAMTGIELKTAQKPTRPEGSGSPIAAKALQ